MGIDICGENFITQSPVFVPEKVKRTMTDSSDVTSN